MTDKTFTIYYIGETTLSLNAIWPDGNAPKNPTAQDVLDRMQEEGSKIQMLDSWNMQDDILVTVEMDDDPSDYAEWA